MAVGIAAVEHGAEHDEVALKQIGKTQQLKRGFRYWSLLGLSASMMCTWEGVFYANTTAMVNGGPATLIYGYIYAFLGALSTAASLAEMASIYPTSGGQYHWTAMLAHQYPSLEVPLSWFCGWAATLGWISAVAAGAFFAATMIQGILVQNVAGYVYHRWHGSLLIFAVILVAFLVNIAGTRLLAATEGMVMILHLAGFLAILVPLLYYSPRGTSHEVWASFDDQGGWGSNGLAWFVGLISANLPLLGYDGPAHLAEEVQNASLVVPWAMISTVLVNGPLGWAVCIAFSYTVLPTFDKALFSPTYYDFIEVFSVAVGKAGAAGMTSVLIVLMWCATFGFLATASRQTWAFARDQGLPFSTYFAKVGATAVPVRSIVLCCVISCLIGLINIGSTVAFNAIISLTIASLFISYLIPICLMMACKLGATPIKYGPFRMGRLGLATNAFSVVFLVLSTFFSFFPPATPVNAVSMNWSAVVLSGFVILGLLWYVAVGRRQYNGPIVEDDTFGTPDLGQKCTND